MTRLGRMMQAQAHRTVSRLVAPWKTRVAMQSCEFTLGRAALLQMPSGQGLRIECLNGCAWMTIDGELQDIVLEPGDVLTLGRHAPVFVSGLPRASVRVAMR